MEITIHRGTHQIGGMATDIRTAHTRIIIDMGDELSTDPDFVSAPLHIPGVTDDQGTCNAVLFSHFHRDHTGQLEWIRRDIPLFSGPLAKDIMLSDYRNTDEINERLEKVSVFSPGKPFKIGDIKITPFSVDHSACDSYMFLIEAESKKILYTGDFRTHGFRGKNVPKILDAWVQKVDILVTEGTTISRPHTKALTESELQATLKNYVRQYKYVFVLCASSNLERVLAAAHSTPRGKYFICDNYQYHLLKLIDHHWKSQSGVYAFPKVTTYGENLLEKFTEKGFVMMVRDNKKFRSIIPQFDRSQSIILYSMWDGYLTKESSTLPEFLALAGTWEKLHTSGHATPEALQMLVQKTNPDHILPMHTNAPEAFCQLFPDRNVHVLCDGETWQVP